jgi:hypothetical protein
MFNNSENEYDKFIIIIHITLLYLKYNFGIAADDKTNKE